MAMTEVRGELQVVALVAFVLLLALLLWRRKSRH